MLDAVTWLKSLVNVPQNSRFSLYSQVWREIRDSIDLPTGGTSTEQIERIQDTYGLSAYRGAVHEAYDLVSVHQGFRERPTAIPTALLEKIVRGDACELDEDRSRPVTANPRDHLFELTVAARFERSGFPVELNKDADVEFNFRMYRVFIECKRFAKAKSFEQHFRKASNQLAKRYKDFGLPKNRIGVKPVGISVLSLSRVTNPNQAFLKVQSKSQATATLEEEVLAILKDNEHHLIEKRHPNNVLLSFYTQVPLILNAEFGTYTRWNFRPLHAPPHKLSKLAAAIIEKLNFEL